MEPTTQYMLHMRRVEEIQKVVEKGRMKNRRLNLN